MDVYSNLCAMETLNSMHLALNNAPKHEGLRPKPCGQMGLADAGMRLTGTQGSGPIKFYHVAHRMALVYVVVACIP